MAIHEGILSIDRDDLLRDYFESCRRSVKDSSISSEKIVTALEMELFCNCNTNVCITIASNDLLLSEIKKKSPDRK
jgi:hypothetical protein